MRMSSHHASIQLMPDVIALTTLFDSIINGPGGIEVREWRSHNFSVDPFGRSNQPTRIYRPDYA